MADQVVDAATARGLHANARAAHALVAWVVTRDPPGHPGRLVARLATEAPTPYVLVADTLAGLHAQLPPGLVRRAPTGRPARGGGDLVPRVGAN
jgi:hypothetical protein